MWPMWPSWPEAWRRRRCAQRPVRAPAPPAADARPAARGRRRRVGHGSVGSSRLPGTAVRRDRPG